MSGVVGGSVVSWLVMDSLCVVAGVFGLVCDGLVGARVSVDSLVLDGVAVMAKTSVLGVSVRVLSFCEVGAVVDKRSVVSVSIDNLVSNDFVGRDSVVSDSLMNDFMYRDSVVSDSLMNNWD